MASEEVADSMDPYDRILLNMREYPNDIPMVDGKVSESFREYIKLLFTPEEAKIAQHLTVRPQKARKIAKMLGIDKEEAKKILDEMTTKGIIQDTAGYSLFMTFAWLMNIPYKYSKSLERMQGTKGGELYQKFFIEEKFYKRYESSDKGTAWNRVLPIGKTIAKKDQIINIEELHQVLEDNMKPIVATDCPCRKRTEILGIREQACKDKNPIEGCCLQLGAFGTYFLKRGEGRELSLDEAHELVDNLGKKGLVFITDNAKAPAHQIICACCECCCAMLRGMTRFPDKNEAAVNKSNYIAEVNPDLCKGCGLCEKRCPFNAITLDSNKKSKVEQNKCFGCGVCAFTCPTDAVKLHRHERSEIMETSPQLLMKIYKENREP